MTFAKIFLMSDIRKDHKILMKVVENTIVLIQEIFGLKKNSKIL